ncbi:hypothetical protein GCM10011365_01520 [Marinicella pacifica]|uniref:DUF4166 domain-containing protein n=1 Tax=Marinicella pacifica TaxID=1171543 RepID=A0A917FH05_9GAMM|nr:DUF4166 domain-containing protein [Marinicella pacifica]GGF84280.1 hypothetical protein GCM10011365_01520 [Marinicella pacifica]
MQKHNTIKWSLGRDWHRLHPNVQKRFNRLPTEDNPILYEGVMERVECSKAGQLFAFLTKVIGNPLSPHQGTDIKMSVQLTSSADKPGVHWKRTYYFPGKAPFSVTSTKKDDRGKMMEMVGGGFGMFLDVYAENGELHFKSTRYFWKFMRWYLPLPHWLSPGKTHVIHQDLGHGNFRFTITMDHPVLKRTFYQTGIFCEVSNQEQANDG